MASTSAEPLGRYLGGVRGRGCDPEADRAAGARNRPVPNGPASNSATMRWATAGESGGRSRASWIFGQDAKLVALRVGQGDPGSAVSPRMVSQIRPAQPKNSFDLLPPATFPRPQ